MSKLKSVLPHVVLNARKVLGMKPPKDQIPIVQIELSGICNAGCEHCDIVRRPKEQRIYMDSFLATKAVRDAKEMKATHISFHVTGESLGHPDLFQIMPCDWDIGLSTNCLALTGENSERLRKMSNLRIILATLWTSADKIREKSLENTIAYLESMPENKTISLQMVTSLKAEPFVETLHETFLKYADRLPQLRIYCKQPYTQEVEYPTLGFIPKLPEGKRIVVDHMNTPQSCGTDCLAVAPNPMTSMLIQTDGWIKPCFKRVTGNWGIGNIRDMTLKEAWNSERLAYIRSVWARGDPDNELDCHDCIRMAQPRNMWWNTTNIPPTKLDSNQKYKGGFDFRGYLKP